MVALHGVPASSGAPSAAVPMEGEEETEGNTSIMAIVEEEEDALQ